MSRGPRPGALARTGAVVACLVVGVPAVLATNTGAARAPSVERPSFVYPPDGIKWLPLKIPGSRARRGASGAVAQVVELRGWLTFVGDRCYSEDPPGVPLTKVNRREPDWHYNLELDPAWLEHLGVRDPDSIVRPGNVINWAARLPEPGDSLGHETGPLATGSSWALIARPIVHVEVTSWDPARHPGARAPTGWRALSLPGCAADVRWPYDPRNPIPGQPALAPGQYVRMVGSLVTDDPHVRITGEEPDYAAANRAIHGILGGDDPTTLAVRLFWEQERAERNPRNGSRWTELHPPDTVEVMNHSPQRDARILRNVLVAPPPDLPLGKTFTFDYTLPIPWTTRTRRRPTVKEVIGPDTRPRSVLGTPTKSRVTLTDTTVQFHITVTRRGTKTTPSAFQASYTITP